MIAAGHRARGLGVDRPHEYRITEGNSERVQASGPNLVCLLHVHAPVWANMDEKYVR